MENLKNCPVCGAENARDYLKCKDFTVSQAEFTIVKCASCGFLFTNPRPTKEEIGPYYQSSAYISHSNSKKGLFDSAYQFIRTIAIKNKVKLIQKSIGRSSGINLLDIGCGTGEFLAGCQQVGWSVKGVEPSPEAKKQAESNHALSVEGEEWLQTTTERYDVITLWHVLEHVHDLNERVSQLSRLLDNSGILIIAVPNNTAKDAEIFGGNWAAWDVPRHLYHFTPQSVKALLKKHGFVHMNSSPMPFDAYYVSLLSTQYENGSKNYVRGFLKGLESNRMAKKDPEKYSSVIYTFKKGT